VHQKLEVGATVVSGVLTSDTSQSIDITVTVKNAPEALRVAVCVLASPGSLKTTANDKAANGCLCFANVATTGGSVSAKCESGGLNPGNYLIFNQYQVDGGSTWKDFTLDDTTVVIEEPHITKAEVVPSTNVDHQFSLSLAMDHYMTDAKIEVRAYDTKIPDLNEATVKANPKGGEICRAETKQSDDAFSVHVKNCKFVVDKTYYYYVWKQVKKDGTWKIQGQQYEVTVDKKIMESGYTCKADHFAITHGSGCWDDIYTCLSCCNTGTGLPPRKSSCWIPGTNVNEEKCCGTAKTQVLPKTLEDGSLRSGSG